MNRSEIWQVAHEPSTKIGRRVLVADPELVVRRFVGRRFYGEVNSQLRHVLMQLPVYKRGVILRHPQNILLSAANRQKPDRNLLDRIAIGFMALDHAIVNGATTIHFEWMTTEVTYMQQVLETFGIGDVKVCINDLKKKINATPPGQRKMTVYYRDVPAVVRDYYEAQTNWFKRKYYGE